MDSIPIGTRIELVHCTNRFAELEPGKLGTVSQFQREQWERLITVEWDDGTTSTLIKGVDRFKILDMEAHNGQRRN